MPASLAFAVVLVCHRRAGKTVATLNDLIRGAVNECKPEGRYAFIFPQRNQAKDTAWHYLRRYAEPLLAKPPNESELRVDLVNGSMVRLYGADNPDALRGPYLDGVVLDEFADMKPEVWHEVVRPMLADRRGWATFIGTPKGKNEFFRLYESAKRDPAWFHMMLKASESGIISPAELADLRREMGEDQYQQEFECSFEAAIKGAFYAEEMRIMLNEGRICRIEIEKDVRVHTAWDLGVSDSTAIWFIQCVGRERRLVDYYESSGVGLNHYVDVLHDKRRKYDWTYGDHFFPHDIKVREFTSGKSRLNTLAGLGIEATVVPQCDELDGINVVRRMLGRVWLDPVRCERGLEALRGYRREYDERLRDWKKSPLHSWESHGASALRYFATGFDDTPPMRAPRRHDSEPRRGTGWAL
jgi:phage terminase large subunit